MSLHEEVDGLLETHVTWQDVEAEMQKSLGTTAKFGENKKATNISDMKGFMSRIALIDPDWVDPNGNESAIVDLPNKFVVKISSQLAMMKLTEMMGLSLEKIIKMEDFTKEAHNREVESYRMLTKLKNSKIPITKIYALRSFSEENPLKGFIISEFVHNLQHIGMHECIPAQDLNVVVKALGTLSAFGEKLPAEELAFTSNSSNILEFIFTEFFDPETMKEISRKLREGFPEEHKDKLEKVIDLFGNLYSKPEMVKKYSKISEYLGAKDVMCHCDPWSSNFLWNKEEDRIILKAVIDWQSTAICNPAVDICRLILSCLAPKDRAENLDRLLELYYNSMLEELGDQSPPYQLEQLVDSYHLHVPIMCFLVLPGILPFLQVSQDQSPVVQKLALEKMVGLVEDVISSHEYNLEKYPDFFKISD